MFDMGEAYVRAEQKKEENFFVNVIIRKDTGNISNMNALKLNSKYNSKNH